MWIVYTHFCSFRQVLMSIHVWTCIVFKLDLLSSGTLLFNAKFKIKHEKQLQSGIMLFFRVFTSGIGNNEYKVNERRQTKKIIFNKLQINQLHPLNLQTTESDLFGAEKHQNVNFEYKRLPHIQVTYVPI